MSDELRAAAERCAWEWGINPSLPVNRAVVNELICDAARVGEAWLAEHPADDAEFVNSADVVIAMGFARESGPTWRLGPVRIVHVQFDGGLRRIELWCGDYRVCHEPTFGDVRRLCRALGVTLREGGAG